MRCPHCGHVFDEVQRWTDDDLGRAVREDASARLEVSSVRETVEPPDDTVIRGEVGVHDG